MVVTWRDSMRESGLRKMRVTDPYTFPEWEQTMSAMVASRACEPWRSFLVDRRQSTPPTTEFVHRMTDVFGRHSAQIGYARVAVVVSSDVNFGMARLAQMRAEAQAPAITIRAFRSYEEAERWLAQDTAIV